jgi:riboflavin synthase
VFTGLIEDVGEIQRFDKAEGGVQLTITTRIELSELTIGESIAVDGACLTLVSMTDSYFRADVSPETLKKTTLGFARPGQDVNLERALRLGDRLGGHLVQGHVDDVGTIRRKMRTENAFVLEIEIPEELSRYVIANGSVAVDGISLTVNRLSGNCFYVTIIPHTAQSTNLGAKGAGGRVNIECDLIGKSVESLLSQGFINPKAGEKGRLDLDLLKEHGFI